jgi:mannose-6-phosphate isomerase-like protein (cupin superfamily)
MSYPDARYLGQTGEATAIYRPADHEPELTYPNGTRCHYLATGKTTRGLFGFYRWEMPAEPSGPGPHFHRTITESFYVHAGAIRIYDGREWVDTQPGDFFHIPEGGLHGFRNESGAPASMLIHFAPGRARAISRATLGSPVKAYRPKKTWTRSTASTTTTSSTAGSAGFKRLPACRFESGTRIAD